MSSSNENDVWWIDCDPGTDDAFAIAMMLAHKYNVVGFTVSLGNGTVEICRKNLAKLLGVLNVKIPVYTGSSVPIANDHFEGTDGYFGDDSFGDSEVFNNYEGHVECLSNENGHFALIEASKKAKASNKNFKILALAPLTTIAVTAALDKDFVNRVDELFIMGGALDGEGFTKLSTEFNFDRDPESAHRVLRDYKNVTMVPIETYKGGVFTDEETVKMRHGTSQFSKFFKETTRKILIDNDDNKGLLGPLFDAICAAVVIDSSMVTKYLETNATIDVEGFMTRGSLVAEWKEYNKDHDRLFGHNDKKIKIILEIDHDKYMKVAYHTFETFSS